MQKKNYVVLGLVVLSLCTIFIIGTNKIQATSSINDASFYKQWGETLAEYSSSISAKENFSAGTDNNNTIIVPESEIKQAIEFYKLQNISESDAKLKAEEYSKRRNALYHEAILNGFDVTDTEIRDFLETQKQFLKNTKNAEEAHIMIEGFGSEEAYWEYELYVHKKNLPIMKYREFLEEQYYAENNMKTDEKIEGDTLILGGNFNDYYESYQQSLLDKYTFEIR